MPGGGGFKSAFMTDFLVMRRRTAGYLLIMAALVVVIVAIMGPLPWIALYTGFLIPLMAMQGLLLNDERKGWQGFRLALPLTRRDVVLGRYALLAAATVAGVALGLAGCAVAAVCAHAFPALADIMRYPDALTWPTAALATATSLFVSFTMVGVSLPIAMRFGYTRMVQFVPAVFMLTLVGAPSLLHPGSDFNASAFMEFAATPAGTLVVAGGALLAACALYAASAWLTCRLCEKKDF